MLLLSAIGGYWVLERAENHKGQLRGVGRLLGSLIIVVSLLGLVSRAWGNCSWGKDGWSCPFAKMGHSTRAPATDSVVVVPDAKKNR